MLKLFCKILDMVTQNNELKNDKDLSYPITGEKIFIDCWVDWEKVLQYIFPNSFNETIDTIKEFKKICLEIKKEKPDAELDRRLEEKIIHNSYIIKRSYIDGITDVWDCIKEKPAYDTIDRIKIFGGASTSTKDYIHEKNNYSRINLGLIQLAPSGIKLFSYKNSYSEFEYIKDSYIPIERIITAFQLKKTNKDFNLSEEISKILEKCSYNKIAEGCKDSDSLVKVVIGNEYMTVSVGVKFYYPAIKIDKLCSSFKEEYYCFEDEIF